MKKSSHFVLGEIEFSDAMAKELGLSKMPLVEAELSTDLQRKLQVATVKLPRLLDEPDEQH